jgi:hypothetical protein
MKILLKELGKEGAFAPFLVYNYLCRNNYLNVSTILRHLENLEHYGFKQPKLIEAIYGFYDLYAQELFITPGLTLKRERSDRISRAKHANIQRSLAIAN